MERKPLSKGHKLGTARGGASKDAERQQWSKGHSPSGAIEGGTRQDTERKGRGGHSPTGGHRGTWQDMERIQLSKAQAGVGQVRAQK